MTSDETVQLEKRIRGFFSPGGALAKELDGYEPRAAQADMAAAVLRSITTEGILIAEAATGTGKTLAYMVPALSAGLRIVVSTGTKNLQEQLFFKDIPFLQKIGGNFTAAVMKGRGNYLCLRKLRQFQKQPMLENMDDVTYFRMINEWSRETATGDFAELTDVPDRLPLLRRLSCSSDNCTGRKCPLFEQCWLVQMRQKAADANIVIVNHHLLLADLSVRDGGFGAVLPDYDRLIVDEAHEIESVATSYFGVDVTNWRFEEIVRDTVTEMAELKLNDSELSELATRLGNAAIELFKHIDAPAERFNVKDILTEAILSKYQTLHDALVAYESHIGSLSERPESLIMLARRAADLREAMQLLMDASDSAYVYWGERRGRGILLKASPIDVSAPLRQYLIDEKEAIVFTSATLTVDGSFDFFRQRLGIEEAEEIRLESHFDYRKQTRLYVPGEMPVPNSREFLESAVDEMERLLELTEGRAFLLFTSLRNMERAHDMLAERVDYPLLLQGTSNKNDLLERFRDTERAVLCASASFWQGVDVRGPGLSLVVIDKLPFAVPDDPLMSARIDRIREEGGNPFMDLQVPSAALTLKQGLGRLIRSASDRGIMAVLDSRLLTKRYGKVFLRSLHGSPVVTSFDAVRKWWKEY